MGAAISPATYPGLRGLLWEVEPARATTQHENVHHFVVLYAHALLCGCCGSHLATEQARGCFQLPLRSARAEPEQ